MDSALLLQIVAGSVFAFSSAAIPDLLSKRGREARAEKVSVHADAHAVLGEDVKARPGTRHMLAEGLLLNALVAAASVYLFMTLDPFRALFPLWCWLYPGYWLFMRRTQRR